MKQVSIETTSTYFYEGKIIYSRSGCEDVDIKYVIAYLKNTSQSGLVLLEATRVN